jgi:hypothetical protein
VNPSTAAGTMYELILGQSRLRLCWGIFGGLA